MDQSIFNMIVTACGVLGGWVLRVIWESIREMRQELKSMDSKMHNDFVRRDDFKEAVKEIKEDVRAGFDKVDHSLTLLAQKLDRKADAK